MGEPVRLCLHTADRFGNARTAGGEDVVVELAGPPGSEVTAAAVACNGNGTYAVRFAPDRVGRWLLHPRRARRLAGREPGGALPRTCLQRWCGFAGARVPSALLYRGQGFGDVPGSWSIAFK